MNDRADLSAGDTPGEAAWPSAIRARRRELGLLQSELADLAGVSTRTVSAIETGKPTVRLDVLWTVLNTLGLRLDIRAPNGGTTPVVMDPS